MRELFHCQQSKCEAHKKVDKNYPLLSDFFFFFQKIHHNRSPSKKTSISLHQKENVDAEQNLIFCHKRLHFPNCFSKTTKTFLYESVLFRQITSHFTVILRVKWRKIMLKNFGVEKIRITDIYLYFRRKRIRIIN